MDDLIVTLGLFAAYLLILSVGGLVADYVFPHIGPLARWIDTLPLMREEMEVPDEKERL